MQILSLLLGTYICNLDTEDIETTSQEIAISFSHGKTKWRSTKMTSHDYDLHQLFIGRFTIKNHV